MSLQLAAQHLSNQGRGPDDTLVHMSRNEVKSLNDLAMAHGGQLTTNPQTGLPEASFLSSLLPTIAGFALNAAVPGLGALGSAAIVGGGSMLLNPKAGLMGGLMAGLGAYGGAGLGAGLEKLGTSEAGATTANAATKMGEEEVAKDVARQNALVQQQQAAINASTQAGGGYGNMDPNFGNIKPYSDDAVQIMKSQAIQEAMQGQPIPPTGFAAMNQGIGSILKDPSKIKDIGGGSYAGLAQLGLSALAPATPNILKPNGLNAPGSATVGKQVVPHYGFTPGMVTPTPVASATGVENTYFNPQYRALSDAEAQQLYPGYPAARAADGGLMGYAGGGPVEQMSNQNAIGTNTGFPQAYLHNAAYATPYQTPMSQNVLTGPGDTAVDPYTGEQKMAAGGASMEDPYRTTPDDTLEGAYAKAQEKNDTQTMRVLEREMEIRDTNKAGMAKGLSGMKGLATGGLSDAHYNLGGYSDGGRLLRGPGDGVSDSIPAVIGKKQPARLADGEFVVPARIVSELGNGSTEAGARRLYAMMDRIQAARGKTTGKGKVAKNTRADKYLPA